MKEDYSVWTTKSKEKIPITEMKVRHLQNTISFLATRINELQEDIKMFDGFDGIVDPDAFPCMSFFSAFDTKAHEKQIRRLQIWLRILNKEWERRKYK